MTLKCKMCGCTYIERVIFKNGYCSRCVPSNESIDLNDPDESEAFNLSRYEHEGVR
jgi:hypothetical protein